MLYKDFLGYKENQPFSTLGISELNKLRKYYGGDTLLETLKYCKRNILYYTSNKHFKNENSKILYILAIVKNNINDVHKKRIAQGN